MIGAKTRTYFRMLGCIAAFVAASIVSFVLGYQCPDWKYAHSDNIEQAWIDTNRQLMTYAVTKEPGGLSWWLVNGPTEGPGLEMMMTVASWAMKNQPDFIRVIDGIYEPRQAEFVEIFAGSLSQSDADKRFYKAFQGYHSKVLDQIMSRLTHETAGG
jgi:hypothetical protein